MIQETPRTVDELMPIVDEVFDTLELKGTAALNIRLEEVLKNINECHSEDLGMWLRASYFCKVDLPIWDELLASSAVVISKRHHPEGTVNDILFGMI